MIDFNRPYLTGKETEYITQAVLSKKISGNGIFTKKCQSFFESRYGFEKCLLTTSCTDALEMAAILCDIQPGDEVIIPSYTFVSSALAFVREGAKIVFADSCDDNPNMDADKIESLITPKTKVIVPVHYAGVACDMDKIMKLANKYNLLVVEDAAQAVDSYYNHMPQNLLKEEQDARLSNIELSENPPKTTNSRGEGVSLGSIGHFGCFSFHETKNIISGEGGMLVINDDRFIQRAEIIWEKGTNRAEFFRGEVNKYSWVDTGSSFLPSEVTAAFLFAQCESMDRIQQKRKKLWQQYYAGLLPLQEKGFISLPQLPDYATNNAHMFYMVCRNLDERTRLIQHLKQQDIQAVFHYLSLHKSQYYAYKHDGRELHNCDRFADCLVRLPLYYELKLEEVKLIVNEISEFYNIL